MLVVLSISPGSDLLWRWTSSGMLPPLPGRTITPGGGDFFVLVNPRERDAAEATGSLLQVPGGVQALLRQREMPLPRGREGSGLCVSHCQRGRGGDTMPVLLL